LQTVNPATVKLAAVKLAAVNLAVVRKHQLPRKEFQLRDAA
jgi:hypothetical protein